MLTKGQQKALDTALDLRARGKTTMLLDGPGGTGKSYATHKIAEAMGIPQDRVQWTATTHKACEALEESDPLCAGAITIQSLLKMRVTDTQEVKSLAPVGEVDLEDIDLVIIDECYTPDMEIMTEKGFVPFPSLPPTTRVAQYHKESATIDYVTPLRYISKQYTGDVVNFVTPRNVDLSVTAEHNMLVEHSGKDKDMPARDYLTNHNYKIHVCGKGVGSLTSLSQEDKLAIAYQADGCMSVDYKDNCNRKNAILGKCGFTPKAGNCAVSFSFKKARKIKRFLEDFGSLPHFSEHYVSREGYRVFYLSNRDKSTISKNFYDVFDITSFSCEYAREFIAYLVLWDGFKVAKNSVGYSNTNKKSADFVQQVATLAGYRSNLMTIEDPRSETYSTCYKVHIIPGTTKVGMQNPKDKVVTPYSGTVYCVTVPSGYIVVRRNGKVAICGNCSFLGRGVVNRIFKVAERFPHVFWIMSGDSYQLLVVREGMSTIFNRVRDSVRLTKNMRQKEKSKVRSTTLEVRAEIKRKLALLEAGKRIKVPPLKFEEELHETGSLFTVNGREFNRMFIKSCLNDSNTVALSWTNRTANSLNNMVRSKVYSDRPLQPYYVGESIWSGAELVDYLEGLVIARSHRKGKVLQVEHRDMIPNLAEEWGLHVSGYRLHVAFGEMSGTVYVPDEAGWKIVNERKAILYKNATNLGNDGYRWSQYHSFVDSVADIRYSWAMTVHSSQGSTLGDTVFIDGDDLNKNKNPLEKLTLWNVALSRSVKDVVIKQR